MLEETTLCACGCGEPVVTGKYAGADHDERESHRARLNRQRATSSRQQQSRLDDARSVLSELGLDDHSPALQVAQVLEHKVREIGGLAVVVAAELALADIDVRKEREHQLRTECNQQVAGLQQALDRALSERQAAERSAHEQRLANVQGQEALRRAVAERADAVRAAERANGAREAAQQDAAQAAATRGLAEAESRAAGEALRAAQIDAEQAGAARAVAEQRCADAVQELREQQLRIATVLAEQEQRHSAALAAAMRSADLRVARERRAAVREVRETLRSEIERLRAELAAVRVPRE